MQLRCKVLKLLAERFYFQCQRVLLRGIATSVKDTSAHGPDFRLELAELRLECRLGIGESSERRNLVDQSVCCLKVVVPEGRLAVFREPSLKRPSVLAAQ